MSLRGCLKSPVGTASLQLPDMPSPWDSERGVSYLLLQISRPYGTFQTRTKGINFLQHRLRHGIIRKYSRCCQPGILSVTFRFREIRISQSDFCPVGPVTKRVLICARALFHVFSLSRISRNSRSERLII